MEEQHIRYAEVGDDYATKDPAKIQALRAAAETSRHLQVQGFPEIPSSRGESAFVWDVGPFYLAGVLEGLGQKNLIADAVQDITGRTYYDAVGYDTVSAIINDLVTSGARPMTIFAHWEIQHNDWLKDRKRWRDLIRGWKQGCDDAEVTWAGGETPTLQIILSKQTAGFSGSAFGIIQPKDRLIHEGKIRPGDRIILIESSGLHTNGSSLALEVSDRLPNGFATRLDDGRLFGEAILTPSHIYHHLVRAVLDQGIDVHYIVNITGHGWQKLMRASHDFTYCLHRVPWPPKPEFTLMQEVARLSAEEMYATFNMGAGYALLIAPSDVEKTRSIAASHKLLSWDAGIVLKGKRQVEIRPLNITFTDDTLNLR